MVFMYGVRKNSPSNDFEGKLPKDFAAGDYLEFTNEGGVDRIIPHMTGGLKKYFCGPEHKGYIRSYKQRVP